MAVARDAEDSDEVGDTSNGGEASCPSVADGTRTACPASPRAWRSRATLGDVDEVGDASDGCEASCPSVAVGTGTVCPPLLHVHDGPMRR